MSSIPDFPEPSWSTSRQNTYNSCPLQYYFQYYESWHGWPNGNGYSDADKRHAYFWSKRETIPMWMGKKIHDSIALILKGQMSVEDVKQQTYDAICLDWLHSETRGKAFRQYGIDACKKPKMTLLMEHIAEGVAEGLKDEVIERVDECLDSFVESGILEDFRKSKQDKTLYAFSEDGGDTFVKRQVVFEDERSSDNLYIWSMLDCAFEVDTNHFVVYDWKTGQEPVNRDDAHLTDQLIVYAHYVLEQNLKPKDLEGVKIEAYENYLPSLKTFGGAITAGNLEDGKKRIANMAYEFRLLHKKIKLHGREVCKPTPSVQRCRNCNFKSICKDSQ